jgi:hypothetical protein
MVIILNEQLAAALQHEAKQRGVAPESLAVEVLEQQLGNTSVPVQPRDEWEKSLLRVASDCGVSLPNEALSSDGLYD